MNWLSISLSVIYIQEEGFLYNDSLYLALFYIYRKVHGFESVADLYKWSSSAFYLKNIKTPMIFINARDDPIVPEPLLPLIREFVSKYIFYCPIILINFD